jgi:cytochrome c peroxidase
MKVVIIGFVLLLMPSTWGSTTISKEELGKMLFFDPRLSVDGSISCNSCHNVMGSGDDNRSFSMGVRGQLGGRSSPTVFNAAYYSVQFWDGRATTLAEQAKGPMINPVEMGNKDHKQVIDRLAKIPEYVQIFKQVYPSAGLSIENLVNAIEVYEKTLVTYNSPFDKFAAGDKKAMSPIAQKGWETFQSVGCVTCHSGKNFSGPELPIGTGFYMKFPTFENVDYEKKYQFSKDLGRYDVTKKDEDKHMFRVPTLRNIANTSPYFHNGSVKTLDEAVRVMAKTQVNKNLTKDEVKNLVAFLSALSGTIPPQTMPVLPKTAGYTTTSSM